MPPQAANVVLVIVMAMLLKHLTANHKFEERTIHFQSMSTMMTHVPMRPRLEFCCSNMIKVKEIGQQLYVMAGMHDPLVAYSSKCPIS